MPVPSAITDLSQTAGSNSPPGSESPTTADDYMRAIQAFIALLRDGKGLSAEVDLASGATCDIGAQNSPFVRITGTTTITSFGTNYNGPRFVRFAGALTLTHNATTLILPGGANIVTASGDTCIVTPTSGGWVVSNYQRASGIPSSMYGLKSYVSGLLPSTAGSSATMTFSAGEASDATGADLMILASAMSKTTSSWAVGSGNGGLDTGAIANNTPYFFWLIKRVDTGVVDILISLSGTDPTMPTNYTLKRLIGWGKTNGSAQWLSFKAYEQAGGGYKHIWSAPTLELNSSSITTSRTTTTAVGLPAFSTEAHIKIGASHASASVVNVCSPDETDAAPSATTTGITENINTAGYTTPATLVVQTNSAGALAVRATASSTTVSITCQAFVWSRR